MAAGLQAEIFEPITMRSAQSDGCVRIADSVTVHGAMEVDPRNAIAMRLEHPFYNLGIGNVRAALIVDDEIIPFGIIGMTEDCERGMRGLVVRMDLVHH